MTHGEDLAQLDPSIERDREELDLHIQRGVPLTATRGYGAPEVLRLGQRPDPVRRRAARCAQVPSASPMSSARVRT